MIRAVYGCDSTALRLRAAGSLLWHVGSSLNWGYFLGPQVVRHPYK